MPLRVLVVDDDIDTADSFAKLVYLLGHVARAVYSGPSALQHADDWNPQVIFLDLGMPGMNGFEAARRLRETGKPFMLVALTGHAKQHVEERLKESGLEHHLLKPVDPEQLEKLLSECAATMGVDYRQPRAPSKQSVPPASA